MRYSKSFEIIGNVLLSSKDSLVAVCVLAGGYILISALVIFNVEPDSFNTFFDAIYWASDENVITIDQNGLIVAVGGGSATISATSANNVVGKADINVDGTKRVMKLKVSSARQDQNNIGDEWGQITEINGEPTVLLLEKVTLFQ